MSKKTDDNAAKAKPEMVKISSQGIALQPRTLMLFDGSPKPAYFYLEPLDPKRQASEGNGTNAIHHGPHQIDPNRLVSHCCVMPNMARLAATGNPYPRTADEDPTIVSTDMWKAYVPLMHALWGVLKSAAGPMTANEMLDDAVAISKFNMTSDKKSFLSNTYNVVKDCLRDLRLFGLATGDSAIADFKKTKWSAVLDAKTVELLPVAAE